MNFLVYQRRMVFSLVFVLQICLAFSAKAAFAAQPFDIAPFDKPVSAEFTTADVQATWISPEGFRNLSAETRTGGHVMVIPCNLPNQTRCYYDYGFAAKDFSGYKEFKLDIYVPNAEAVRAITLYFESVADYAGVYAQDLKPQAGWQTLTFSVAKMGAALGSSASSWSHITKIRISPWNGSSASGPTELEVRGFRAIPRSSVAVIQDAGESYKETSAILNSAFIKNDLVTVAELESGYLSAATTPMIVLPYNIQLSAVAIAKLQSFVAAGGRLTAFGAIDPWLQSLLGVSTSGPLQNEQASFQFSDSIIANLPASIKQVATPVQVAAGYPAGNTAKHARVIAKWSNSSGPTQYPAWIASDTGLYMSSKLLADINDPANASNQWKMFIALLNQYQPNLAMQASLDAFSDSQYVGKYTDLASLIAGVNLNKPKLSSARVGDIDAALVKVNNFQSQFNQAKQAGNYILAIEHAKNLKLNLRDAYNFGQLSESPDFTDIFRGVWSHDGFGPYMASGGWARAIPLLRENGFNALIVNESGAGFALYNTATPLPKPANYSIYGDQLASVIREAHAAGIKVHAWDLLWNLYGLDVAPGSSTAKQRDWYETLKTVNSAGVDRMMSRVVKDSSGVWQLEPMRITTLPDGTYNSGAGWISPCNQENRNLKKQALLEMATNYDIDGLHLDYNRANGEDSMYEESCRQRYKSETGIGFATWPSELLNNSDANAKYNLWRSSVISSFTKEIHDGLIPINDKKRHLGKPIVILSASVFPNPVYAKEQNAQDWADWISMGIIDQLHPMNYTDDLAVFNELVRKQNLVIANRIPFYPGIGIVTAMPSDASVAQIVATRGDNLSGLKTNGFTLYNFANVFADNYVSVFGHSVTSNITAQVVPPVVRSQYFAYREGIDGNNLTSVNQVNSFISGRQPTATFIATQVNYGNDNAFYTDLGHGDNLQTFLGADAVSLSSDPGESSDAIMRIYGTVNLAAGSYKLKVRGDDGYQVKIDGTVRALVNYIQAPTDNVHSFTLTTGGSHSLEVLYWDQGGQAVLKIEISSDGGNTYKLLQAY